MNATPITEERILDAARQLVSSRGFAAEITEVAALAQVGMKSIYTRWPNREALIGHLLDENLVHSEARARWISREVRDPEEAIRALNRVGFDQVRRYGVFASLVATGRIPPEFQHALPRIEALWQLMGSIIKRGSRTGVFREDVDTRLVVLSWLALVSPDAMEILKKRGYGTNEMADHVSGFVIASVSAR